MNIQKELLDLDAVVSQISRVANAVAAMSRGLDKVDDPYADGFFVICEYLEDAVQALRKQTDRCLRAV